MTRQAEWELIWAEEFDGPEINTDHWNHELLDGQQTGNNELQHYSARPVNSFIKDGKLVIKAIREDYKNHAFSSARMTTQNKFSFRYGRVEGRIKIPSTKGIWPAFWMMPQDSVYGGWPHSGEIDIMESVNIANETYGTIHFGVPEHAHTGGAYTPSDEKLMSEDFHVYAIEWDPQEIRWYVDDQLYSTKNEWKTVRAPYPAPFDQEFYLILNVAVGGNWPGSPDETSQFPQTMEVDWIRVYQLNNEFPTLKVLSPASESTIPGGTVRVLAEANDPDGRIKEVRLYKGKTNLAQDTTPPYELVTDALPDGCYKNIFVAAEDEAGLITRAPLKLIIGEGCPQGPYQNQPAVIPGVIEAENFDIGMAGEAYYDNDPGNNGSQYRPDSDVDIENHDGGTNIGWTATGEWLEYEVEVREAGRYEASVYVAGQGAGGGLTLAPPGGEGIRFQTSSTGKWHNFQEFAGEGTLNLGAGRHVLRLTFESGGTNVDRIEIRRAR